MKANDIERKRFDEALDVIIDLFNNLENDRPIIQFNDEVLEQIEKAKIKYGEDTVHERINKIVQDMLAWLDLEDVEIEEEEESGEEE